MLDVELNTEYLLYACLFLILILIYCLFMKNKTTYVKQKYENESDDLNETQYLINNNEILKKKINVNDIICTCKTFYIEEDELKNCQKCIQRYLHHLEESNKKRKKCLSFPN